MTAGQQHPGADGAVEVSAVRFEHHRDALGVGERRPRLSWQVVRAPDGWVQAGYELRVVDQAGRATIDRVDSAESVLVPWPGAPLDSREARSVQVRVTGADGGVSGWSDPVRVETGLLDPADWSARLITSPFDAEGGAPLFRRGFTLPGPVESARLHITSHGVHEAELNGVRVADETLAPGWTSYGTRLRYRTHDVTSLLRAGDNVIGATVADGWYRGRLTPHPGRRAVYGDRLGLLAQLEVTLAGGRSVVVATDGTWSTAPGPVRAADLYEGEWHDATAERAGWSSPGGDDDGWVPCGVGVRDPATLVAPEGPPVRAVAELPVAEVLRSPSGALLLDFGQNVAGRLRIRVTGPAGTRVQLRHAEVLEDGELGVRPLNTARATDTYVLRGGGEEVWEPRFTLHGFRYAEVQGWPGAFDPTAVTAVVHSSDLARTGWFSCSDPLLDRLHENVVWSMRGNFVDVPTDCPQRDERLGWTGDVQVFAPTAAHLHDCAGLLTSWLQDLAADQEPDGTVPVFVPYVELEPGSFLAKYARAQAGWGDAAVIVPWVLYQRFDDLAVLRRQYGSMCRWVDGVTVRLGDQLLWDLPEQQLGDWLDPTAPPDRPALAATDTVLVATAYRAHSARLLARIAGLLGERDDAARYGDLADRVTGAWQREFVGADGEVAGDTQTGHALALIFGLLPDPVHRERAGERLVGVVRERRHRIATGFLGTPLVLDALTEAGALEDAYALLRQTECPSWLYPVTMGATTIWERWDSMLPDGRINPGTMTSFNHYALGAVADWVHRVLGGLAPASPGYRHLEVHPRPGGGITWARTGHETPYGLAEVAWRIDDGVLGVEVLVPVGCSARVTLPVAGWAPVVVGPGRHGFRVDHPG
ncbi:alpha-L-rhamnosidase [Modestobacter roseus]|uniref:alpha-L-rhamnosidase n=1 Tax=Modestobacter roseus TaxID=1181884 RepID=A0A562IQU3_9ACTN|nr:alpha-L-rhamnosidase [Modestobacter roseus]